MPMVWRAAYEGTDEVGDFGSSYFARHAIKPFIVADRTDDGTTTLWSFREYDPEGPGWTMMDAETGVVTGSLCLTAPRLAMHDAPCPPYADPDEWAWYVAMETAR